MIHEGGEASIAKARFQVAREVGDNKVVMTVCRHCTNPKCMSDCPCGAMSRDERDVAIIKESGATVAGTARAIVLLELLFFLRQARVPEMRSMPGPRRGPSSGTVSPTSGRTVMSMISQVAYPFPWYTHYTIGGWLAAQLKFAGYDNLLVRGKVSKKV
jgi:hypothetical protein